MAYNGTLIIDTKLDISKLKDDLDKISNLTSESNIFESWIKSSSTLTNSIRDVISQYDSLSSCTSAFTNMGYDADLAGESVIKLLSGMHALPESLEAITNSTAKLAELSGSLKNATSTTIALNHAFLSSGSSSSDAVNGITQYVDMLSSGKVNAENWQVLQNGMNDTLEKAAASFGLAGDSAVNNLYKKLESGEITFASFNDKIVGLNTKSNSFSDVMKNVGSAIGTAFNNINSSVSKGADNISKALDSTIFSKSLATIDKVRETIKKAFTVNKTVDEFSKSLKYSNGIIDMAKKSSNDFTIVMGREEAQIKLNEIAQKAKEKAEQASKKAADLSAKATEAATKAENLKGKALTSGTDVTKLSEEATKAATIAEELSTEAKNAKASADKFAEAASKSKIATSESEIATLQKEMDVSAASVGIVTGKTGALATLTSGMGFSAIASNLLKGATESLNAAFKANPIGFVISAITTLIPIIEVLIKGISSLFGWLKKDSEAYKENTAEIDSMTEAQQENKKAIDDANSTYKDNISSIKAQESSAKDLAAKIQELSAKENKSEEDKRRLAIYTDRLNESQEDLNLTYDEETDTLSHTNKEINAMIESNSRLAKESALKNYASELTGELAKAEVQIDAAIEAQKRYKEQLDNETLTKNEYLDLLDKSNATIAAYTETKQNAADQLAVIDNDLIAVEKANAEERSRISNEEKGNIQAYAEQWGMSAEEIQEAMDQEGKSFDEWSSEHTDGVQKVADDLGVSSEEIQQIMKDTGMTAEEVSDKIKDTLKKQEDSYNNYFESVSNGFDKLEQKETMSMDTFLENMRSNREATEDWSNNMKILMAAGIDQGIIAELEKLGPAGADQAALWVQELTNLNGGTTLELDKMNEETKAKLAEIANEYGLGAEQAVQSTKDEFEREDYLNAGVNSYEKMAEKINDSTVLEDTAKEKFDNLNILTVAQGEESGTNAGQAYISAVSEKIRNDVSISEAMQKQGNAALESFVTPLSALPESVANIMQNVSDTMHEKLTVVSNHVDTVVSNMTGSFSSGGLLLAGITGITAAAILAVVIIYGFLIETTASNTIASIGVAILLGSILIPPMFATLCKKILDEADKLEPELVKKVNSAMLGISVAIGFKTFLISLAIKDLSTTIKEKFSPLIENLRDITNNMMDGIKIAMDSKSSGLYSKARAIANEIANTMRAALGIHSPSRVMISLFGFVMDGAYEGLESGEDMLYRKAENIADMIAAKMAIEQQDVPELYAKLNLMTEKGPLSLSAINGYVGASANSTTNIYEIGIEQNNTSPDALSPSEMTRQSQNLARELKWKLC